jgi:vancomycin resistance protein VanJ
MAPVISSRFLIKCDAGLHKVALDPAKFWKPAACPVCQRRLDRYRFRRTVLFLKGEAPRSGVRFGSAFRIIPLEGLVVLWGLLILLVTLALHTVADAWWPATLLLFLGRWPWLLPAVPLFWLAAYLKQPRAAIATAVVCVIALFGVMEFTLGTRRFLGSSSEETRVRVITYNIDGDGLAPLMLTEVVTRWEPDILAVQECGEQARAELRMIARYQNDVGTTCLLTKFPILRVDSLKRENFLAAGGAAWVKRYRLQGPHGEFDFTNLHLDTPRKAFDALMEGRGDATDTIRNKTDVRNVESRLARRWVDQGRGPRLVAGDFNMPTESAIFREHWSTMQNGFDVAGFGFGYSRLAGWIRLRIDHVLADESWRVRSARVLPDYGSDHLPVMVEVERRRR